MWCFFGVYFCAPQFFPILETLCRKFCGKMFQKSTILLFTGIIIGYSILFVTGSEINLNLQTSITCQPSAGDACGNVTNSWCNSAGYCQCNFRYAPYSISSNNNRDACKKMECKNDGICWTLNQDENTYCERSQSEIRCECQEHYAYDMKSKKC